jgi:hypothetical protein
MELIQINHNDTLYKDIAKQYCKFYIVYSSPEAASLYLQSVCEENNWTKPPVRLDEMIDVEFKKYGFKHIT